jgi:hypothetical protein
MSRYLQINDEEEAAELSSNAGWTQFVEWVDGLDKGTYPALAAFSATGTTEAPQDVADEIEAARDASPPIPDVESIADTLFDSLDGE